jgi:hypothetical protein
MPFFLIPLLAGGAGIVTGFFASSGIDRISTLLKWLSIAFLIYFAWKNGLLNKLIK